MLIYIKKSIHLLHTTYRQWQPPKLCTKAQQTCLPPASPCFCPGQYAGFFKLVLVVNMGMEFVSFLFFFLQRDQVLAKVRAGEYKTWVVISLVLILLFYSTSLFFSEVCCQTHFTEVTVQFIKVWES